ncbi:hypothetical protein MRX96_005595 [Rhipicephalus microplus]
MAPCSAVNGPPRKHRTRPTCQKVVYRPRRVNLVPDRRRRCRLQHRAHRGPGTSVPNDSPRRIGRDLTQGTRAHELHVLPPRPKRNGGGRRGRQEGMILCRHARAL